MLTPKFLGVLMLGAPLLVAAWALLWRNNRQVFFFALALILVGLGYLAATGATDEIANAVLGTGQRASVPAGNAPLPSEYPTK